MAECMKKFKVGDYEEKQKLDWRESDLSNVKDGDLVFTSQCGWGKVNICKDDTIYPVRVENRWYTRKGKWHTNDKYPSCWTYCPFDPPVPKPEELPERPDFEVDHKILIFTKNNILNKWHKRHFAGWPEDKKDKGILVFPFGQTSFSSSSKTKIYFPIWKDAEEEQ